MSHMPEDKIVPADSSVPFQKMSARQRKRHRREHADDLVGEFLMNNAAGREQPRFRELMERLYEIAKDKKTPHMAAVTAVNALVDRGVGKVTPSEEETEAAAKAGIRMVFVQRPEVDAEIVDAGPVIDNEPEFEEGENGEE